jgi:hypothetical protein
MNQKWPVHPVTFASQVHAPALLALHRAGLGNTALASRMNREHGLAIIGNHVTPHMVIASAHFLNRHMTHGAPKEAAAARIVRQHLDNYAKQLPMPAGAARAQGPPPGSAARPFAGNPQQPGFPPSPGTGATGL